MKYCDLIGHLRVSKSLIPPVIQLIPPVIQLIPPVTETEGFIVRYLHYSQFKQVIFLIFRLQLLYSTYKCIKTVRKYFLPISKRKFFPTYNQYRSHTCVVQILEKIAKN